MVVEDSENRSDLRIIRRDLAGGNEFVGTIQLWNNLDFSCILWILLDLKDLVELMETPCPCQNIPVYLRLESLKLLERIIMSHDSW